MSSEFLEKDEALKLESLLEVGERKEEKKVGRIRSFSRVISWVLTILPLVGSFQKDLEEVSEEESLVLRPLT